MKITRLETIWIDEQPNTMWLRIHTDAGLIGLGETFYVPRAVSAVIHDVFATLLIGRSPFDIERLWHNMFSTVNFFGYGGSETRAISAVDVALWDILGQYDGRPIYHMLGGRSRERILQIGRVSVTKCGHLGFIPAKALDRIHVTQAHRP